AAAYVRGVQSRGVAATVKHLVGNEAEHQRYTISSDVDERPLREIYLVPLELAVRVGGALGIMTSYNRLNGRWCTEQPELLRDILRDEWGFEGFVVTDWFAVAVTEASAGAGVDLEMPGPGRAFGPALAAAVRDGRVDERLVDEQVTRLLTVLDRIGALDDDGPGDEGGEGGPRPSRRSCWPTGACCRWSRPGCGGSRSSGPTPPTPRSWAAARRRCARTPPPARSRPCGRRSGPASRSCTNRGATTGAARRCSAAPRPPRRRAAPASPSTGSPGPTSPATPCAARTRPPPRSSGSSRRCRSCRTPRAGRAAPTRRSPRRCRAPTPSRSPRRAAPA